MRNPKLTFVFAAVLLAQTEDPAVKAQRGKEFITSGRFGEAAAIYAELVKIYPENAGLQLNLGMAYHMADRPKEAVAPLEAAVKLQPSLFPANLFLGGTYLKLGRPVDAVAPLERAVKLQPDHRDAQGMLAGARFSEGLYYESIAARAREALPPDSPFGLVLAASDFAARRQFPRAFTLYRRALAAKPDFRGVRAAIAEIYTETGHIDWAGVEEAQERKLPPLDCKTQILECHYRNGRYSAALRAARGQKTPEALYWQFRAATELAAASFARLEKLPETSELWQARARAHRDAGRHQESVQAWREASKLAPQDRTIETELALTLRRLRDWEAAALTLERLLRDEPDSPELNYLLGDSLLNMQQVEKAIPPLERAARGANMLPARGSLGRALMQAGRAADAAPHLEAALSLDEDGSLHFQLSRAYQAVGRSDPAQKMLAKYQEMQKRQAEQPGAGEITPP